MSPRRRPAAPNTVTVTGFGRSEAAETAGSAAAAPTAALGRSPDVNLVDNGKVPPSRSLLEEVQGGGDVETEEMGGGSEDD